MPRPYFSEILDHLGLVAGMFDELGIGDILDHATPHTPETRLVTGGYAVQAMVLNGLGCVNHPLSLVPRFLQHKPTPRLVADSALDTADNLQKLAATPMQWISRVPATVREAHAGLAHAAPQTLRPRLEGYRSQTWTST